MPKRLMKCKECKGYTISEEKCPSCHGKLESTYPAKFSLDEKYQKYRLPYFREKMDKDFAVKINIEEE